MESFLRCQSFHKIVQHQDTVNVHFVTHVNFEKEMEIALSKCFSSIFLGLVNCYMFLLGMHEYY